MVPFTRAVFQRAAEIRAQYGFQTPDALHLATAENAGCKLFITNDGDFRGLSTLPLVILDDLLKP